MTSYVTQMSDKRQHTNIFGCSSSCAHSNINRRHGVWTVHGRADTGIIATGGGDATVKVWIPSALTLVPAARGSPSTLRNPKPSTDATRECRRDGVEGVHHSQEVKWESVGGVRGTIGAVGAVLMTEETLLFGTSEALIADFPLHSCMPLCP